MGGHPLDFIPVVIAEKKNKELPVHIIQNNNMIDSPKKKSIEPKEKEKKKENRHS